MARYTGPTTRIARKFGEPIYGPDKTFEKRNTPPGQHGLAAKRKKQKEYGIQLKEKQKVKYMYGVLERQFRNTYARAARMKGQTARQLVLHRHITLDGAICNIPSCQVKPGQVIAVRERSKSLEVIQNSVAAATKYSWLEFDPKTLVGKFLNVPARTEIPENINEQLIVDIYSK